MADQLTNNQPSTPAPATGAAAPPPKKSNANKVVAIILIVLFVLLLLGGVGTYLVYKFVTNKVDNGAEQINQLAQEIQQYPDSYKQAGLPEYPNAELTSLSKKDATVHDGVSLVLSSKDSAAKVAEYYDTQLKAKGWVADGEPTPFESDFYYRTYKKGDEQYAVTVQTSTDTNEATITIAWNMIE